MTAATRQPTGETRGGSATSPVTVAINAQVNPANPGGAEAAIQGLLAHLADESGPD